MVTTGVLLGTWSWLGWVVRKLIFLLAGRVTASRVWDKVYYLLVVIHIHREIILIEKKAQPMPLNLRSKRYGARGGAKKKGRNRLLSSCLPKKTRELVISNDGHGRSRTTLDGVDGVDGVDDGAESVEKMVARAHDLDLGQDELVLLWTTMGGLGRKAATTASRRREFGHWVLVS